MRIREPFLEVSVVGFIHGINFFRFLDLLALKAKALVSFARLRVISSFYQTLSQGFSLPRDCKLFPGIFLLRVQLNFITTLSFPRK